MLRFHDNLKKDVKSIIWIRDCREENVNLDEKKKKKEPARKGRTCTAQGRKKQKIKIFRNAQQ